MNLILKDTGTDAVVLPYAPLHCTVLLLCSHPAANLTKSSLEHTPLAHCLCVIFSLLFPLVC